MKKMTPLILPLLLFSWTAIAETTVSTTVTQTGTPTTTATPVIVTPPTTTNATTTTTTTTQVVDTDTPIVSGIYSLFAKSAALIGTNLTVASKDGMVTITGSVTAQAQADEALRLAQTVPGVKDVQSNITVTTNPVAPPTPVIPNY